MSRLFGCEFEFSSDWDEVEPVVRDAIMSVYGPHKLTVKQKWMRSHNNRSWHMKEDSTTVGEVTTPVSVPRDLDRICRVVDKIRDGGVKTSVRDGFHVHVQGDDVDPRYIVASWARVEKTILSIFPGRRRRNGYCLPIASRKAGFVDMMDMAKDHHSSLSLSRLNRRGTIEFRLAEGTFDSAFVWSWASFCIKFVGAAKEGDPYRLLMDKEPEPSLRQVLHEVGMESAFRLFDERRRRFGRA